LNRQSKERISWYFYDWANSAFATTIVAVFIAPYLTVVARNAADAQGYINLLGIPVFADSLIHYSISLSVILQLCLLPIVGALADYSGKKKLLLGTFSYIGAISSMLMYFLYGNHYMFGSSLFIIANLCFGASSVVYNSYLNDIAQPADRDHVSSVGFAIGYLGGGILLAANLLLFSFRSDLGLSDELAIRICLFSAGAWWAVFTLIPLAYLGNYRQDQIGSSKKYISTSISKLIATIKDSRNYPITLVFLIAYFFYNDGVQVVFYSAAQFGKIELGLDTSTLVTVILIVQIVGFVFSILTNKLAKVTSTKTTILITLVVWMIAIYYAYAYLNSAFGFYMLGIVIGTVLGGTQALSRSLYSRLIPKNKEAEYFSLFELSDKGTSILGPFIFGLTLQLSQSYRFAILSIGIFFVIGSIILIFLNVGKGISAVEEMNN
jgi:UMF1 family MFS transporter